MIDLEARLGEFGDLLDVDDAELATAVRAAVAAPRRRNPSGSWRAAAVVLVVAAAVVVAVPSTRSTVRGWLGLDRVEIERRDDLVVPDTVPPLTAPRDDVPATNALGERAIVVDGTTVLLGTIDGRLDDAFVGKTATGDAPVVSLAIDGKPGLWIEEPHEVYVERDGEVVLERIAGATLLWQDGDVLWRVEGFATLDDAIAFVRSR